VFRWRFPIKILDEFLLALIQATWPIHLILDLTTLIIHGKNTSYEAPHYEIFSSLLALTPLRSKYYPQHHFLKGAGVAQSV
jgi:hypothetical protein